MMLNSGRLGIHRVAVLQRKSIKKLKCSSVKMMRKDLEILAKELEKIDER